MASKSQNEHQTQPQERAHLTQVPAVLCSSAHSRSLSSLQSSSNQNSLPSPFTITELRIPALPEGMKGTWCPTTQKFNCPSQYLVTAFFPKAKLHTSC